MLGRFSKSYTNGVIVSILLFASLSANADYSNDPSGNIFIQKPFADINNCGPLSALMLTKFVDANKEYKNINIAIDDARMAVQDEQRKNISYRWWRFQEIKEYLKKQQVNYSEIDTKNFRFTHSRSAKIVKSIAAGNVIVINVDMNDLEKGSDIGKTYGTTPLFGKWGHFLIIVGYKKVNGQLAYEIHDSYSVKGRNRLFYAKDINNAISKYNKKLLLVKKQDKGEGDIFSQYFQ